MKVSLTPMCITFLLLIFLKSSYFTGALHKGSEREVPTFPAFRKNDMTENSIIKYCFSKEIAIKRISKPI